jgi:hypothetical protein
MWAIQERLDIILIPIFCYYFIRFYLLPKFTREEDSLLLHIWAVMLIPVLVLFISSTIFLIYWIVTGKVGLMSK